MIENKGDFSWIPIYKEIAQKLLQFENKRSELIDMLLKMKEEGLLILSLKNKDKAGNEKIMDEIDPFSFFSNFNRGIKNINRIAILSFIKNKWGLISQIPESFDGIPVMNNQKAWFLAWEIDRGEDDINILWEIFKQALEGNIEEEVFNKSLEVRNVKWNLTMGLFWINPDKYLNLDGINRDYLKTYKIKTPKKLNFIDYIQCINEVKIKLPDLKFYEFSRKAWEDKHRSTNYWIFQANPKIWKIEDALKNNEVGTWSVAAHKEKMGTGDKFILYITGNNSGIYATGEVSSNVYEDYDTDDVAEYSLNSGENSVLSRVDIKIENNWVDNHLEKDELKKNPKLNKLKIGINGTNFSATKEEYEEILKMRNNVTKKYWLFSPGENAEKWDEFYSDGIMGLGWDQLGDLNNYKDKKDIQNKLKEIESTDSSKKNDATANFEFKEVMSKDDIIIVKKGIGELVGYGEVLSDYYYDSNRPYYQKLRKVKWLKKGNWKTDHNLALKTLTDITKYDKYYEKLLAIMDGVFRIK